MHRKGDPIDALLQALGAPGADRDYRPGHARMAAMLAHCDLREPALRIRVAGTNGKGSTATMVAAGLQAAGLKVGLYTSPHLHRFHERIRIDGAPVDDRLLRAELARLLPIAQREGGSYFELATVVALALFGRARVDAEVLEAGVGARLDATTAVAADMALITPIALDHQAWLGETLAEIAAEKAAAGVGCRWVLSARQAPEVARVLAAAVPSLEMVAPDPSLACAMIGAHQQQNGALALAALTRLQQDGAMVLDDVAMQAAVTSVTMAGRLQRYAVGQGVVWLDVAHNGHAVAAVADALPAPVDAVLIYTREDRILTDQKPILRTMGSVLVGDSAGWDRVYPTVEEALQGLLQAQPAATLLVLGSFITVAAAQRWIAERGGRVIA